MAPWYVSLWDLLRMQESGEGADTPGTQVNAARNRLREFVGRALQTGELRALADAKPAKATL